MFKAGDSPFLHTPQAVVTTSAEAATKGRYLFAGLKPGYYFVHLPASQFQLGAPLHGRTLLAASATPGDDNLGQDGQSGGEAALAGVSTSVFALLPGLAPTGSTQEGGLFGTEDNNGSTLIDANVDLTRDFGFAAGVGVGNLVFHDVNDDGVFDPQTETPLSGVRVELWTSSIPPTMTGYQITNQDGLYGFHVPPGTYHLRIPAEEFQTGGDLHTAVSSTDPAISSAAADDDGGEDGQDDSAPEVNGIRTRDLVLQLGTQPVAATGETGVGSDADDLADASSDLTVDFGFHFVAEEPPPTFAQWQAQHAGQSHIAAGDDPDEDGSSNLLEHALGLDAFAAATGAPRFRVERSSSGKAEAVLIRPIASPADVRYFIQGAVMGGNWHTLSLTPSVTFPGDGTQVLRYTALEEFPFFSPAQTGHIRLLVELDADMNGTAEATTTSTSYAFARRSFPTGQTTFSQPLFASPVMMGRSDHLEGSLLVMTGAGGTNSVTGALSAEREFFVHVLDGSLAGHRFEVNEASCTSTGIALVASSECNTLDFLPVGLGTAKIALRPHWSISDLLPAHQFATGTESGSADNVMSFEDGDFVTHWAGVHQGVTQWMKGAGASAIPAGGRVVPFGEGLMVHARGAAISVTLVGEDCAVRGVVRLGSGSSLLGSLSLSAQSAYSLGMLSANGFITGDSESADRLRVWQGDATAGASGYDAYYYDTSGVWMLEDDLSQASHNLTPLMNPWRAVFVVTSGGRLVLRQP